MVPGANGCTLLVVTQVHLRQRRWVIPLVTNWIVHVHQLLIFLVMHRWLLFPMGHLGMVLNVLHICVLAQLHLVIWVSWSVINRDHPAITCAVGLLILIIGVVSWLLHRYQVLLRISICEHPLLPSTLPLLFLIDHLSNTTATNIVFVLFLQIDLLICALLLAWVYRACIIFVSLLALIHVLFVLSFIDFSLVSIPRLLATLDLLEPLWMSWLLVIIYGVIHLKFILGVIVSIIILSSVMVCVFSPLGLD